jgi:hypothetical protein
MLPALPQGVANMFPLHPKNTKILLVNDTDSQEENKNIFQKLWNAQVTKEAYLEPNLVVNG